MLEIIEQQQGGRRACPDVLLEGQGDGTISALPDAERIGDLRRNQIRIVNSIQRNEGNASRKLLQYPSAEFDDQARLADASGPRQRRQSHMRLQDQLPGALQLLL